MEKTDVAIAGGGPVGLALALYLARAGVDVVVLERDAEINMSPRAMVYLHELFADLDAIGMLEPMAQVGAHDVDGFNMWLRRGSEHINLPLLVEDGDPYPFHIHLGQGEFCRLAVEQLAAYPNARVLFGAELVAFSDEGDRVTVRYDTAESSTELVAQYLVGADGGRSTVRRGIGATLEGTTWDERFVATNVRYDFGARGFKSSNMYVDPELGCIIARITDDGLWRCTYQESDALPEETVEERIAPYFARLLGPDEVVDVVSYRPYRMHQRLATTLRSGRVVLAGDAAHLTNPTGGLGLTTGLFDVVLLQEALLAVLQGRSDDRILDEYAAERARVFSEVSSPSASNFKRMVYDSHDPEALEQAVSPIREASKSVEGQRAFMSNIAVIRSPDLLAG
jgi:3-(3-hydroxy-phenyl)propionate hydroxylase/6-hydroxy-3-succinoylpyridine 3-monooxygenase